MKTDTTEKDIESLTMRHISGTDDLARGSGNLLAETAPSYTCSGWFAGSPAAYDR